MTGAFLYLTVCSTRNSVRLRLRRWRQPRYLLIGLGLFVYAGSILWNRPFSKLPPAPADLRLYIDIAAAAVATAVVGFAWMFSSNLPLAFSSAEVHLLFPAPITRRQLIAYKLWRSQLGVLATTLFFTMFMAPLRPLPAAAFAGRTFVAFSLISLYMVGVALHRKRTEEGFRVPRPGRTLIGALAAGAAPIVGWIVSRVALAPPGEIAYVLPAALLAAAVCAGWVLRSDAAFEEAAAEAAEEVRLGTRVGPVGRPRVRPTRTGGFRLAPRGPIETAILWKNWKLLSPPSLGFSITIGVLLAGLFIGMSLMVDAAAGRTIFAILSFMAAGAVALMGPAMLRIDLRRDLAHLAIIKTWPVRGAAVLRGQVLAPLLALAGPVALLVLVGTALDEKMMLDASASVALRATFALSAVLVTTTLILALLVIQNGITVTFPAWVSLAPESGIGGVERMGQGIVVLYGGLLLLALAAVVPTGVAIATWFLGVGSWTAPLLPGVGFAAVLAVECVIACEIFGRILDRTDLQDLGVAD